MNVDFPAGPVVVGLLCSAIAVGWSLVRGEVPRGRALQHVVSLSLSFLAPFLAWTMVVSLPMRRAAIGLLGTAGFSVDVNPGAMNWVFVVHVLLTYAPPFALGALSMRAVSRLRQTRNTGIPAA